MDLPIPLTMKPMEAKAEEKLPAGDQWIFEPKYDGFRCLAFRDGAELAMMSKSQKRLERYFPEVAQALLELPPNRFVLDGEIRLETPDFEAQQLRIHPAASRVAMLAAKHPAQIIAFDLLLDPSGRLLTDTAFGERRAQLEECFASGGPFQDPHGVLQIADSSRSRHTAMDWLGLPGVDGVMAKDLALAYKPGKRAMIKHKLWSTMDCVVGGLHLTKSEDAAEAFLLGLYDDAGRLHYVGRAPIQKDRRGIYELLQPMIGGAGFTGRRPERRDRWSGEDRRPVPLEHRIVVEISTDLISGGFMRHGARVVRMRPDKPPESCTVDQLERG